MRNVLDLSDYHDVARNAVGLQIVLGLPTTDPNSMPVTRDLSPSKRSMLVDWLGGQPEPTLMQISDLPRLQRALQLAIELEHATIPAYLTAFLTLEPGRNREVSDLILSVFLEEMLHMALACNILNAVGGARHRHARIHSVLSRSSAGRAATRSDGHAAPVHEGAYSRRFHVDRGSRRNVHPRRWRAPERPRYGRPDPRRQRDGAIRRGAIFRRRCASGLNASTITR